MKTITKDELLKKFPFDFSCRVWYRHEDSYIFYNSTKNVRWKDVRRITVIFDKAKVKFDKKSSEFVTRDGATFLLK